MTAEAEAAEATVVVAPSMAAPARMHPAGGLRRDLPHGHAVHERLLQGAHRGLSGRVRPGDVLRGLVRDARR